MKRPTIRTNKPPARRKHKPAPVRRSRVYARTAGSVVWLGPDLALGLLDAPRLVSLVILMACLAGLAYFSFDDRFYVYRPVVMGHQYVDADQIIAASGMEGLHVAWVNSEQVAQAITGQLPDVKAASARCVIPALCTITVEERRPVFVWRQGDARVWVDAEGMVFSARGALESVPTIEMPAGSLPLPGERVGREWVENVLALSGVLPGLTSLRYTAERGLEFFDPGSGCPVYLGNGPGMEARVAVWQTLSNDLAQRGIRPAFIDVRHALAPYYSTQ